MTETGQEPLSNAELDAIDAWWRAANYLSVGQIYLLDNPLLTRAAAARARQAAAARPLGHHSRPEPHLRAPQPGDRPRDLDADLRRGPGHGGPALVAERLPGGHLHRALPRRDPGRGRAGPAVPAVLLPRRHPVTRGAGDPRLDPRGRRARLRADPRLRRRVRQPRPDRGLRGRRRRGRDRAAGGPLALEQVPQPGHTTARCCRSCTSTAYKIANPTVLARIPHRRAARPAERLRLRGPTWSRATTRQRCTSGSPRPWTTASTRSQAIQRRRARSDGDRAPAALADDRAAHAQGLDRAQRGRRAAGRGHLAGPPGAARRRAGEPGAPGRCWSSGCAPTARRSCSTRPAPGARAARDWPRRRPRG